MSWKRATSGESPISRRAEDVLEPLQESAPSPTLPADHVLSSGAVLFPGTFDQHGCPLVMFPVDGQYKLSSGLSKAEVVDFISYFQYQHNKKQEKQSMVSVVADLRDASLSTISFIVESLLLLELQKRTVHTVYILQPKKKDLEKLMLKLLAPSKDYSASFKRVLLREIPELQNYIDRSQLPWSLGGYLMYRHQSWVAFIKEIDAFVQEFVSVVQRLPSCISALQALSRLSLPTTVSELRQFCFSTEAKFQQLRRELGLDQLLRNCESLVGKLRWPDREPCFQDMAGTALFTQMAFDMLQNHSRITAAVEKVELLWQQLFSKAHLRLRVFQLRDNALQVSEKIETLLREKIRPFKVEIAKDPTKAVILVSEFEASIHTPAMALVRWAEDVIQTSAEILPLDSQPTGSWAADLERLKDKLDSAVNVILQTLRAVSSYHRYYSKASCWYSQVLCQNFLQELLSGVREEAASIHLQQKNWGMMPGWRWRLSTFLKNNPPPEMEELLHLSHLASAIPDDEIQQTGKRMSQRCLTLRKLLGSSGPVAVEQLQMALQWQYELLRGNHVNLLSADSTTSKPVPHHVSESNLAKCKGGKDAAHVFGTSPLTGGSGLVSATGKPPSPFAATRDFAIPASSPPQIHDIISSVSDCRDHREEHDLGSIGNSPKADLLNEFEIKVKPVAAVSSNPWLSLPVEDLENSYTVSSTQNPAPQKVVHNSSDEHLNGTQASRSQIQPTPEVLRSTEPKGSQSRDWILHPQSCVEHPELSPICSVLSSTVIEGKDQSICSIEGVPTLLWDSYDLHDQNQDDDDDNSALSMKDWDVKEEEGLREVEKILDKADEILEEEENVLAQEAVLDALLRTEDRQGIWRLCDGEDQLDMMSSCKLAEAGVLCFDDCLDSAESDGFIDLVSAGSARETKAAANGLYSEAPVVSEVSDSRPDLLLELRKVHILDGLIMEENLQINKFRCSKEKLNTELLESKPTNVLLTSRNEREASHLQLEKEKREVEELERSIEKEFKAKQNEDIDEKFKKCSITERPRKEHDDRALCDLFPNGSGRSVTSLATDGSENTRVTEIIQDVSDLKEPSEEAGVQSQYIDGNELARSASLCSPEASLIPEMRVDDGTFDPGGKSLLPPVTKPRKSLLLVNEGHAELETPHSAEVSLDRGHYFVDEGQLHLQDKVLEELPENVPPDTSHSLVSSPNVTQHEDDNHVPPENCWASLQCSSEIMTKNEKMSTSLLKLHVQSAEEIHTSSPADDHQLEESVSQVTADQPLEFDPSGRDEPNEKLPDGVQSSEALRISGSPESQIQFYSPMTEIADFKSPIVLDTGSGLIKAGFADQDLPSIIFPTIIGVPKYEEVLNGNLEREAYIGHDAEHMRGVLTLKHPIKNGIIHNWDEMEKIWHHTFQQLRVEPEDHPVLLTEAAMNPLKNRQHAVEIMFECFNVPFTYVAMQAVLALYAAGRTTGVVFDSGDGVSHSVPVFEGYCLPHAVQRFPLAGLDVTLHLKKLLREQGVCMRTTAEEEIVREMKEKCCCVALNYEDELSRGQSSCREMHYTMPDGQIITLGTERFRAPEILFKPELIGRDHYGMHESIYRSILSTDIDLRRCFLGNIVLSGGNTLLPGLPERLQDEIKGLLPSDMGGSVCVTSPKDRDSSVWRGGAVLANMPTFTSAWIGREEYEEYGPQIVFRKCF
ncbi:uncharacterized protein LOC100698705 isoform X1 [Oreochromis niloticus]|uniref:Si:ch211-241j12.3 n=1 Tax=Oreochromis niloticus TaxID=8128 RepID=I3IZK9_ORENI|nr:uncharacterized protein LOC100698705 isoform X1 [Oreochromis niloticus]